MNPETLVFDALGGNMHGTVPTMSMLADTNISNQVAGRDGPNRLLEFLNSPRGSRFIDSYGGAVSWLFNLGMFFFGRSVAEINRRMGFDAAMLIYWRGRLASHDSIEDVFGRRFSIVDDGFGNAYMMYRDLILSAHNEVRLYVVGCRRFREPSRLCLLALGPPKDRTVESTSLVLLVTHSAYPSNPLLDCI